MEPVFAIVVIIIVVVIFIPIFMLVQGGHEKAIREKIEQSMGGKVISTERRGLFSGIGPFNIVGKNRTIYRVVYEVGGKRKEIWVRFGGWGGAEWRENK